MPLQSGACLDGDYAQAETPITGRCCPALLDIAGLALITFVCVQLNFVLARTGFAYVILLARRRHDKLGRLEKLRFEHRPARARPRHT